MIIRLERQPVISFISHCCMLVKCCIRLDNVVNTLLGKHLSAVNLCMYLFPFLVIAPCLGTTLCLCLFASACRMSSVGLEAITDGVEDSH